MPGRKPLILAWIGLGLWSAVGCGGFLDPLTARGTGGSAGAGGSGGSVAGDAGGGTTNGGGGTGGTDGSVCGTEAPLLPDSTGWVEHTNCCPVQGAWYYYDDGFTLRVLPTPPDASDGGASVEPTNNENKLCTKGRTAARSDAGSANVWGAGIALWLNQLNLDAGGELHNPIGQLSRIPIGFRFSLIGTLGPTGLRVNFPYSDNDTAPHFVSFPQPGLLEVRIANAKPAPWATDAETIDRTRVVAIQFMIPAGDDAIDFDFCVNELTVLF
jgi:hypothetical protein